MADLQGAQPLKDIVSKVISDLSGVGQRQKRPSEEDINRLWERAVGRRASKRSRPALLRKGKLVINVEDSSLLYELTLRKQDILENLARELADKIRDIQFRIGETRGEERAKIKKQKSKTRKG